MMCVGSNIAYAILEYDTHSSQMANRLYVGNLPYSMNDDQMRETFSQAGNVVSVNVMIDKQTGRSRGFGFVEMASDEEAQKAIEMFNGQDVGGRKLVVNEAKPMEARPPRTGGFNRGHRSF